MHQILFRGKTFFSNEWVYGYYINNFEYPIIVSVDKDRDEAVRFYRIQPESVGQYVGMEDSHGNKIFEGDVVKLVEDYADVRKVHYGEVGFSDGAFMIDDSVCKYYRLMYYDIEVVGNKFDDPDLLEKLNNEAR